LTSFESNRTRMAASHPPIRKRRSPAVFAPPHSCERRRQLTTRVGRQLRQSRSFSSRNYSARSVAACPARRQ
jgi:hypothetical protein